MLANLRYAVRTLRSRPGFTLVAVLTLSLGIGASTAIFSVVNSVLLKPLAYPDSDRLVSIWSSPVGGRNRWVSPYADYADWKAESRTLEHIAAYNNHRTILRGPNGPTPIAGLIASPELFSTLEVKPELGRTFTEDEDRIGVTPVVVLSHDTWERYFNADKTIIGTVANLGDRGVTVIGVMPRGFNFPANRNQVDYYMPLQPLAGEKVNHRSDGFLRCVARLKSGVSVAQSQAELTNIASRLASSYPDTNTNRTVWVNQLHEDLVSDTRPALLVLLGSVLLVLLIACANVANLLLANATARVQATAIRAALGASRSRIATQLLTESAMLAAAGCVGGLFIAQFLTKAFLNLQPASITPFGHDILDVQVLMFVIGISVLVTLTAGTTPVLQSVRVNLVDALKDGGRSSSDGRSTHRTRSFLVVAQVALSVTLLIGAGLLLRSFVGLTKVSPGFDATGVYVTTLAPGKTKFKTADERNLHFEQILNRLTETPGIEKAASISPVPFGGSNTNTNFSIVGNHPAERGLEPTADYRVASSDYFALMRIPLLKGRFFSNVDRSNSTQVVIVNESFANRFFAGQDPLNQLLIISADPRDNPNPAPRQIVGVVADVSHSALDIAPVPELYVPLKQEKYESMDFIVRERPGFNGGQIMRDALRSGNVDYIAEPRGLSVLLGNSLKRHEFMLVLLGGFSLVALVLALSGLYAVMSYVVSRRTHEFGIRMALGAQMIDIWRLVVRTGMMLVFVGLLIGLSLTIALTRVLSRLLFGVAAFDVVTFVGVSIVLILAALLACYLPARRASKVDPLVALRNE